MKNNKDGGVIHHYSSLRGITLVGTNLNVMIHAAPDPEDLMVELLKISHQPVAPAALKPANTA